MVDELQFLQFISGFFEKFAVLALTTNALLINV